MFEYMQKWKDEGKIKHIGFSFYDSADVLDKILTEHPEVEVVQIVVNISTGIQLSFKYVNVTKLSVSIIAPSLDNGTAERWNISKSSH